MAFFRAWKPVLAACVLFFSGCAGARQRQASFMTRQQTADLRARLGRVGMPVAGFLPKSEVVVPAKGVFDGAGRGAMTGTGVMLEAVSDSKSNDAAVIGLLLTPAGALVGGVVGAFLAESPEVVERWEAVVGRSIRGLEAQQGLRDAVLRWAVRRTGFDVVPVEGQGPLDPAKPPDYRSLKEEGAATVLEVAALGVGLEGNKSINPDLVLVVAARARVVSTEDGQEHFSKEYRCGVQERKFSGWAAHEGAKLRAAFNGCCQRLARDIIRDVFQLDTLLHPE